MFRICGPKCSICWVLLSIWGIIQLGIMGVLYYIHSLAFVSDLPLNAGSTVDQLHEDADKAFKASAINCWIAAGIYVAVLLLSSCQLMINNKSAR